MRCAAAHLFLRRSVYPFDPTAERGGCRSIAEVFRNGQTLTPELERRIDMASAVGKITEVTEGLDLTVTVAGLPADGKRLLVTAPGPVGLRHRAIGSSQVAQDRAFRLQVTDFAGSGQRPQGAGECIIKQLQPRIGFS